MNHGPLDLLDVDLVIIITAYFLVYFGGMGAGIFALCQGLLFDVFSAGPLGLFTFLYWAVFLGLKLGSLLFDLLSARGQITLITLAVFFKQILFIAFLRIFSFEINLTSFKVLVFVSSALFTGILAPSIFYILKQVNHVFIEGILGPSGEGR
ncbi:MAG: hypothetical protein ABII26_05785 [Pseudomonadota bacterium]